MKAERDNGGRFSAGSKHLVTHGMTGTRFYIIWSSMLSRCNKKSNRSYKDYGARGIKVLWRSFEEFRDDMYESYLKHVQSFGESDTTIERKNNNENYCKGNCTWATKAEQSQNRSSVKRITYDGRTESISEWGRITGLGVQLISARLINGWCVADALTKPKLGDSKKEVHCGICRKKFLVSPSKKSKYCSRNCMYKSRSIYFRQLREKFKDLV